ncbi:hypothetical protein [Mesorhizobium sp.]|uniref:hypothetical protein n=1 Tax=Mesorhizobium sp. TaxID=1871066 RepID=UPI00257CBB18|nr:hypothetical protein [Mesorhizobium sp.]
MANEFGLYAHVSVPLARDGVTQAWVIAAVELQKLSDITRELFRRDLARMPSFSMAKIACSPTKGWPIPTV